MLSKTLISLFFFLFVFNIATSSAQVQDDAYLWTMNLGFSQVKNSTTGNSLDAYSFNTTVEKLIGESGFAVGMNLAYLWSDDAYIVSQNANAWVGLQSLSWYLTGKYYFNRSELWVPYVGLGVGVHHSYQEFALSGDVITIQDPNVIWGSRTISSLTLGGVLGINAFVTPDVYLGFNVAPVWMDKTYYEDDMNWIFNLGIGFQFN